MQRRGFFGGLLGLFAAGSVPVAAAVEPMQFDDDWSEYEKAFYRTMRQMGCDHKWCVDFVAFDRMRMEAMAKVAAEAVLNQPISTISAGFCDISAGEVITAIPRTYY